jgi:hypothetical protein
MRNAAERVQAGNGVSGVDWPPMIFNPGGMTCGDSGGSAVAPLYSAPFEFSGEIHSVTVDLSGDLIKDTESEMRVATARQ